MAFKSIFRSTWLSTIFLIVTSCDQSRERQQHASPINEGGTSTVAVDSIVFSTSNKEYVYLGERLYPPSPGLDSIDAAVTSDLLSIERVGDTVFAFLDTDMLYNQANVYLPQANDSLLKHYYPQHYDVEIDDDVPYIAYLRSSDDYIQFIRTKSGVFYLETATIRDTVMRVLGNIQVGLSAEAVFEKLRFPTNLVRGQEFSLILCHGAVPHKIWFKRNRDSNLFTTDKPTLQVLLRFESNQLKVIYIDPWIGYGTNSISQFE